MTSATRNRASETTVNAALMASSTVIGSTLPARPRPSRITDRQIDLNPGAALDPGQIAATWIRAMAAHQEMWALGLELSLYQYRNAEGRRRSVEWRRRNRATFAEFIEHHIGATGLRLKAPAETIAAVLSSASDGFMQAVHVDPDAEEQFATFLELFLPAVVEPAADAS